MQLTTCVMVGRAESDFFSIYSFFFTDLHIHFPLDDFTMGVLCVLNVAPTQLYLNLWATLQAFCLICDMLRLSLILQFFLHYFSAHSAFPTGWLSLVGTSRSCLFSPFTSSYKNFKSQFFKVYIEPPGRSLFFYKNNNTRFPFYWTQNSVCYSSWPGLPMMSKDQDMVRILDPLPKKLPTQKIIVLYWSLHRWGS